MFLWKESTCKACYRPLAVFLDSDDELYPNFNDVVYEYLLEDPVSEILILGYDYIDTETGKPLGKVNLTKTDLVKDSVAFMINNKIVNSSLIKKELFHAINGFDLDDNVLYMEDRAF